MPWDNNTGGGNRNNNGGGPWGQAPGGGGGGRRGGTPSLEEILARGRDRFQGGVPGGRWAIAGIVVAALVFWGLNAIYTIDPQEVGVELLFGKPEAQLSQPGAHFHWWPIEQVERVSLTENQTSIGSVTNGRGASGNEGLMLSSDQNIVDVRFTVLWSVSDPIKYLFDVREPEDMVRAVAESAMRQVVGSRPAQDIFRDDKAGIQTQVQGIVQSILDQYSAGVHITQIAIDSAAPPAEVADAFDEVQRAEQDEDRFQEVARGDANTMLGNARGQAAQMREDALGYRTQVVEEAKGEAARFLSVYNEYIKAPDVTRKRLYLETMEQVLGSSSKVVIDKGAGSGVVPYLPLPEIKPGTPSTPAPAGAAAAGAPATDGSKP